MPLPVMRNVYSGHIDTAGYSEKEQALYVAWDKGRISVYSGVPAWLAERVLNSPSVGSALHSMIKGKYVHHYYSGG